MNRIPLRLYALAARLATLTVSSAGAMLGLFSDTSLVAQIHDQYAVMDSLNWSVILVALLGFADLVWHDVYGRLIWPSFPDDKRHKICVLVYSYFGAVWMMKAFVAASSIGKFSGAGILVVFSLAMASVCGATVVAIALEKR